MLRLLSLEKNVKNLITSVLKSTTGAIAGHCAAIVWIQGHKLYLCKSCKAIIVTMAVRWTTRKKIVTVVEIFLCLLHLCEKAVSLVGNFLKSVYLSQGINKLSRMENVPG